jgi:putative hydrolase of the HAD superfamily
MAERADGRPPRVWLFDLDNTLHDAAHAAFGMIDGAMNDFIARELDVDPARADWLRRRYWERYGATLLGLVRHHRVSGTRFLADTHRLPGLEGVLRAHPHDIAALRRLRGRKIVLTNAPRAYAERVLRALGLAPLFDAVIAIEDMRMFGHWRPKPDRRMFRRLLAQLRVAARDCVLVEDTLAHQKAARAVGMRTVWMRRWVRRPEASEVGIYLGRPMYVCARICALQLLQKGVRR